MDANLNKLKEIIKQACASASDGILEFQSGDTLNLWAEPKALPEIARCLFESEELSYQWLENMVAVETNRTLVLIYLLRSSKAALPEIGVKVSLSPPSAEASVECASVQAIWPMAQGFEREISDLFGVLFGHEESEIGRPYLPEGWVGYPLRKSYVFPTEFNGISHLRPAGHSHPDEFNATEA